MKHFFILPFLFLLMSQSNQRQLAVRTAAGNLLDAPFRGISTLIAQRRFESMARTTERSGVSGLEHVACFPEGNKDNNIDGLLRIVQTTCGCGPWGDCTKEICACEKLCPNDFNIFKRTDPIQVSTLGLNNSLAFRNGSIPSEIEETNGYCWGHSMVTSRFNRLGFFNSNQTPPFSLDSTDPVERGNALQFYRSIIDEIVANKPKDIPGFPDLYTFSSHPDLQPYIADKVARLWADKAMSIQGLNLAVQDQPKPRTHNERFIQDVKRRLSLNIQPTIVFTYSNVKFLTHATLVSETRMIAGQEVLCVRDNGLSEELNAACRNYIFMTEDGKLAYNVNSFYASVLGGIDIAFNDDRDALTQAKNLTERCKKDKDCR